MTAIASRVFTLILAFATGAGTGFVLTIIHGHYVVQVGDASLPVGLFGSLAIVAALLVGMRLAFGERAAPIAAAVGVILGAAVLLLPGNSGSLFAPDDPAGYVWAVGPTVIAIIVVGWPAPRRRVRPTPAA